jgi:transposase
VSVKIVEFKLSLSSRQKQLIDDWMGVCNYVWNRSLKLLDWLEYQSKFKALSYYPTPGFPGAYLSQPDHEKAPKYEVLPEVPGFDLAFSNLGVSRLGGKQYALYSDRTIYVNVSLNDYPEIKSGTAHCEDFGNYKVWSGLEKLYPGQFVIETQARKGVVFRLCSVGCWVRDGRNVVFTQSCPIASEYDITKSVAQKRIVQDEYVPDAIKAFFTKSNSQSIPSKFINNLVGKNLLAAWKARFGEKGRPKYKSRKNPIDSLIDTNTAITKDGVLVGSNAKVLPGDKIYFSGETYKAKGLNKRWGNRYVKNLKIVRKASSYYLQLTGDFFEPPRKIKRHEPGQEQVVGIDVNAGCFYATSNGDLVPPKDVTRLQKRLLRLQKKMSRQKLKSQNWQKTKKIIGKLHERIANRRRTLDHYHSTQIVRKYSAIAVEDLKLNNMSRKAKTKVGNDGEYAKNRRKQKSGLTKKFIINNTPGRFIGFLKSKSEVAGRIFKKVRAAGTSQTCNNCGHQEKDNRKGTKFLCLKCGHIDHADTNAAKNIRDRADFFGSYPAWAGDDKPVEHGDPSPATKQEAEQSAPRGNISPSISTSEKSQYLTESAPLTGQASSTISCNNSIKKATRKKRSAQTNDQIQLGLDLWGDGQQ